MQPFPLDTPPPQPPRELNAQDRAHPLAAYFARQRTREPFRGWR